MRRLFWLWRFVGELAIILGRGDGYFGIRAWDIKQQVITAAVVAQACTNIKYGRPNDP